MSYNNFSSNSNSDYHLFSNSDQNVMVPVRIGDVIVVCGNIKSWRIVENKGGTYSLSFLTQTSHKGRRNTTYVVAPGRDPKNPYTAIYRIRSIKKFLWSD